MSKQIYCILNFKKQDLIFCLSLFFIFCNKEEKQPLTETPGLKLMYINTLLLKAELTLPAAGLVCTAVWTCLSHVWRKSQGKWIFLKRSGCPASTGFSYGAACQWGHDLTRVTNTPRALWCHLQIFFSFSNPKPLHPSVIPCTMLRGRRH